MATRYVWSKYNRKSATSETVVETLTYVPIHDSYGFVSSVTMSSGKFSPSGNVQAYARANGATYINVTYKYCFVNNSYPATYVYKSNASTRYAWYDSSANYGLCNRHTSTNEVLENAISKIKVTTTYSKGSTSYGYTSNSSSSKYPSNSYSGSYWYVYTGSDCIDPTTLICSKAEVGKSVTITATKRSNTYGGTISYLYEYSVDGGNTWTTIETTTATSTTVTVPDGAKQFQTRVRASDDMGFTSTTYVYTDNVEIGGSIGRCGIDGAIREGAFHACVDGVVKTDFTICACVDGVIKECS